MAIRMKVAHLTSGGGVQNIKNWLLYLLKAFVYIGLNYTNGTKRPSSNKDIHAWPSSTMKPGYGETQLCANIKVESGPGNNIPTRNIYFPNPGLPEFHGIFSMRID